MPGARRPSAVCTVRGAAGSIACLKSFRGNKKREERKRKRERGACSRQASSCNPNRMLSKKFGKFSRFLGGKICLVWVVPVYELPLVPCLGRRDARGKQRRHLLAHKAQGGTGKPGKSQGRMCFGLGKRVRDALLSGLKDGLGKLAMNSSSMENRMARKGQKR